jgi:hypothetical protein
VKHAYSSHENLRRVFPELPEPTALAEGIRRMAEWVKRVGARAPVEFEAIEVTKNLPPSWAKTAS